MRPTGSIALPKGGKLVIFSLISNDDQTGPWYVGFMSLYFQVLATGIGNVYPPSRYETWFANANFSLLAMHTKRQASSSARSKRAVARRGLTRDPA